MSDVIRQETTVFFLAIALGAGLSFLYDFLRVLRRMIRHGAVATGIEDLLFWLFGACLLFALMFYGTDGELRGYVLLGTLCGALLYLQTAKSVKTGHANEKGYCLAVSLRSSFFGLKYNLIVIDQSKLFPCHLLNKLCGVDIILQLVDLS